MKEKNKKLILYIIICFLTIFSLYICLKINKNRIIEETLSSSIKDYLTEIKYEEISNHITENPNEIIYISNSSEKSSLEFEENLIPIIKRYNLENTMIFININNTNLQDPFYQNAPQLIFYKNNEVSDLIDCSILKDKKQILAVLKERGYIND